MEELSTEYRGFAEGFAAAVVARDFDGAHECLASWLGRAMNAAELERIVADEVRMTAEAAEASPDVFPAAYEIGWNSSTLASLREPRSYAVTRAIADDVTDENFRQWMKIQFQPAIDEEVDIDAYFDLWMIVVDEGGRLAVGYFETADPD